MSKNTGCPIREEAEKAARLGQDFNRALRLLHSRMAVCRICREGPECAQLVEWNGQILQAIHELSEEWNLAGTL